MQASPAKRCIDELAANRFMSVAFLLVAVVDPFSSADLDDPDNPPPSVVVGGRLHSW